jgi:hypothetical protein
MRLQLGWYFSLTKASKPRTLKSLRKASRGRLRRISFPNNMFAAFIGDPVDSAPTPSVQNTADIGGGVRFFQ